MPHTPYTAVGDAVIEAKICMCHEVKCYRDLHASNTKVAASAVCFSKFERSDRVHVEERAYIIEHPCLEEITSSQDIIEVVCPEIAPNKGINGHPKVSLHPVSLMPWNSLIRFGLH